MSTSLTKLRQKQDAHYAKAQELNELASAEGTDTDLIPDLIKQVDEEMAAGEALDADIQRAERLETLVNRGKAPAASVDVTTVETSRKVTIPAQARRVPIRHFLNQEIDGMRQDERAYAFGRYLLATAARTSPGKFGHFQNYIRQHEDSFGPMMAATEGGNAGVWVPTEFGTDIIDIQKRYGVARNLLNVLPMFSDKRTDPKIGSDPTPVFVGEGVEGSDVTPTDDSTVTLTARKLMAILLYSSELNEDAVIDFADNMLNRTARGFANKEDSCAFNGTGTSAFGGMIGIRTKLSSIDGAGTNSAGLITGTGNLWSELTLADFEQVVAVLPDLEMAADPGAQWVTHRTFYYQTMVRVELAQGGSTGAEVRDGMRTPLFMGWPVVFSNVFPSTAANSSVVCTFGDHSMCANFGDRRSYSIDFSEQATVGSVNLWSSDQIGIKATERFDIVVHSVGDSTNAGPVVGLETASS